MLNQIQIVTQSFGQTNPLANTLVIEINSTTMLFCELNSENDTPYFIQPYQLDTQSQQSVSYQLTAGLNHLGFLKKKYDNVWITVDNIFFTLCPEPLFEPEQARSILEFNCGDSNHKPLIIDDLTPAIKLIYAVEEELKSTCDKLFPQHQIKHRITLLSRLMLTASEFAKEDILVAINEQTISMILKRDHQIVLANQYQAKTNEDVLYYILFIVEQYQLNPQTIKLSLIGNFGADAEIVSLIKKYIKQVRLAVGHKSLTWDAIKGMPQHFNYTLTNRLFCE